MHQQDVRQARTYFYVQEKLIASIAIPTTVNRLNAR